MKTIFENANCLRFEFDKRGLELNKSIDGSMFPICFVSPSLTGYQGAENVGVETLHYLYQTSNTWETEGNTSQYEGQVYAWWEELETFLSKSLYSAIL